jgi:probable metal-binding protein
LTDTVHGHAVLEMLLSAERPMTRAELGAAAASAYGPDARYHTCSAEGMTLDELLQFLLTREKIDEDDGVLAAHRDRMCVHG